MALFIYTFNFLIITVYLYLCYAVLYKSKSNNKNNSISVPFKCIYCKSNNIKVITQTKHSTRVEKKKYTYICKNCNKKLGTIIVQTKYKLSGARWSSL